MAAAPPLPASAIVIGASLGGVEALKPLLSALTRRSPPVLVVVHPWRTAYHWSAVTQGRRWWYQPDSHQR